MFLLDTNICIYLINNKSVNVVKNLQKQDPDNVAISVITACELIYGAENSSKKEQNLLGLEKFFTPLHILNFEYGAALEYGRLRAELESKGQMIGSYDSLIAAQALSINATLVTNNTKEFSRVKKLKIVNWT